MAYTVTIELRVDFDTANKKIKEPAMLMICKRVAAELLTRATMIADTRAPQIAISDGDFFSETKDIVLDVEELDRQEAEANGADGT